MATGWVRAYRAENEELREGDSSRKRSERAIFRKAFRTQLRRTASVTAVTVKELRWGDEVDLPQGLLREEWTPVIKGKLSGFVKSSDLVELAYVKKGSRSDDLTQTIEFDKRDKNSGEVSREKRELLWGDLVQIIVPGQRRCQVRSRGIEGTMNTSDLTNEALLEVYFIDVGQGDGVLLKTPDGRHLLIDGGLERSKQQTGKNAADFVDWKFFADYGHYQISLDSLMASHSDNDHYGGLHDLVRVGSVAERELDCTGVKIKSFHHPGISRWKNDPAAPHKHKQGLGETKDGCFIQLLEDREDAERSTESGSARNLSGPWKSFVKAVLANSKATKVARVGVEQEKLGQGNLPSLWKSAQGCDILVLAPVSKNVDGKPALPDFKKKSYNTNGHSICLRVDYGNAKILLTGDLNGKSMNWLEKCYGAFMGAWECDVAKACHHGSHDISYRFLEKIHAAATIISSGDAEGHAHPRPEIVAASALTGFSSIDRAKDRLVTPLVYMTEIERSVSLGALNRIDFRKLPVGEPSEGEERDTLDGAILGRNLDEMNNKAFMTPEDRWKLSRIRDKKEVAKFMRAVKSNRKGALEEMEKDFESGKIRVDLNLTVPQGPLSAANVRKRAWQARVMDKNHYGLVNVRTDGKTILCATMNETGEKWITHTFEARFDSR